MRCGKCQDCLFAESRQWAIRLYHEAQCHEENSFVTLTYSMAPAALVYEDFRLFMRRLRKRGAVRFFVAGEYGEQGNRPHWHAILFGRGFADRVVWKQKGAGGEPLYRSKELEVLWPHGFSSVGNVTFQSAAYVARYVLKKYGERAGFQQMSRRPGIGAMWYSRFKNDVRDGRVVVSGAECNAPRFYMKRMKAEMPFRYRRVIDERDAAQVAALPEQTPSRLEARGKVAAAKRALLKRSL